MHRRGPDGQGAFREEGCTLLHARLSIIDPAGGGAEMIIKDKGTVGGPLEQFSTVGYKFETNGATILYPERVLRVMSVSSYSANAAAN